MRFILLINVRIQQLLGEQSGIVRDWLLGLRVSSQQRICVESLSKTLYPLHGSVVQPRKTSSVATGIGKLLTECRKLNQTKPTIVGILTFISKINFIA